MAHIHLGRQRSAERRTPSEFYDISTQPHKTPIMTYDLKKAHLHRLDHEGLSVRHPQGWKGSSNFIVLIRGHKCYYEEAYTARKALTLKDLS